MEDKLNPTSSDDKDQLSDTLADDKDTKGAGSVADDGAGDKKPVDDKEPKTPRTYTEEEWGKRQSSIDTMVEALRGEHKVAVDKLQTQYKEALDEVQVHSRKTFLTEVEAEGGDVDVATKVFDMKQGAEQKERELASRIEAVETVEKHQAAEKYAKTYELDEEAVAELLKAENPAEMKATALQMALEKSQAGQKGGVKTKTPQGSAQGVDLEKMSGEQKLVHYFTEEEENK